MIATTVKFIFIVALSALLYGCATVSPNYAPVTAHNSSNAKAASPDSVIDHTKYHLVKKSDTLYAISLLVDVDYRQLAQWNQIAPPYTIEIGQKIRLSDPIPGNKPATQNGDSKDGGGRATQGAVADDSKDGGDTMLRVGEVAQGLEQPPKTPKAGVSGGIAIVANTQQKTAINRISRPQEIAMSLNNRQNPAGRPPFKIQIPINAAEKYERNPQKKSIISIDKGNMLKLNFQWPIKGKVLKTYSSVDNKGIDIAGKMEQEVSAAEAGKVVYSGQGLIGYGNLLIIKHNDTFLSAYANNSQLLVAEGYAVEKGEVIAKVGQTGSNKASLHFEIRKNGKPVNPLNFLPNKH